MSTRRSAVAGHWLGGGIATGGIVSSAGPFAAAAVAHGRRHHVDQGNVHHDRHKDGSLPADQIQQIVEAEGTVTKGVLSIDIERNDIGDVSGPLGVTLTPAFEIDGTLTFPLGRRSAFFNGDIAIKPEEAQGVIDAIIANGLIFQAFHQHYIETSPNVWFIHFAVRASR
jgi:Domain of Unknown Function (DUF1259)